MSKLYTFLKYFFIVFWAVFVVAPFLWALTTSFIKEVVKAQRNGATTVSYTHLRAHET